MTSSMKAMEFQLHENLVQLQELLSLLDFDPGLLNSLEQAKTRIRTRKYRVAVMGEFKRGKKHTPERAAGGSHSPGRRHAHHCGHQPDHLRLPGAGAALLPRRHFPRNSLYRSFRGRYQTDREWTGHLSFPEGGRYLLSFCYMSELY